MDRTHERFQKMASAYVDAALSTSEMRLFERHCEECGDCRTVVDELRKVRTLVSSEGPATVPPYFMTRLHARLKERAAVVDPWVYEAKRLFPVFSLIAIALFLLIMFGERPGAASSDDYYLSHFTAAEHRVLMQHKAYTDEEVFVLAVTNERIEK